MIGNFLMAFVLILLLGNPATAHCPLCTGAIGATAVSAKYYGLDLTLIGMLIGAFGISTGLWAGRGIKRQFISYQLPIIVILSFLLTVIPLRFISEENIYIPILLMGEPGSMLNRVYWIDKIIFGGIIGGFTTILAFWLHIRIKKLNGKVLFPYQGIALTLALLLMSGLAMHFTLGI